MEKSRRAAREGPANPGAGNAASSRLASGNPSPAPSPGRNGGGHASNGVNSMDGGRRTANVTRSSSRDRRRKRQHRRSR